MRPPPTNEDLAIVSFDPLPGNVLNFGAVRNIVREFLIGRCINLRDILPCHLGQAYVRFQHAYERDQMVLDSPMVYGNVHISFVKHNNISIRSERDQMACFRIWENLNLQGNTESILVQIPTSWVRFFNTMLMSADNFEWAKKFLVSSYPKSMSYQLQCYSLY